MFRGQRQIHLSAVSMREGIGKVIRGASKATEAVANASGNRLRWSTKNTMGGLIVTTACEQIVIHGITWQAIALCFVGILPLALSTLDS
jgi:hypothetical protein